MTFSAFRVPILGLPLALTMFQDLKRWPHQLACLTQCQKFLTNSKRDWVLISKPFVYL
jgi:uncharacterized membrane-anchored protein